MMKNQVTHDTSVVKLDGSRSPRGPMGEKYLASGVRVSMRLWEAEPVTTETEAKSARASETTRSSAMSSRAEPISTSSPRSCVLIR